MAVAGSPPEPDIPDGEARVAVAEKGALDVNLLGMSFLGRLASFDLRGDELILLQ